jgi:Glyoxalase-like domain
MTEPSHEDAPYVSARVSEVVLHVEDVEVLARFWSGALGRPAERADDGTWVGFPLAPGLRLLLLPRQQWEAGADRLHLDLSPESRPGDYVERLVALGATVVGTSGSGSDSVVLNGPEGLTLVVHPF